MNATRSGDPSGPDEEHRHGGRPAADDRTRPAGLPAPLRRPQIRGLLYLALAASGIGLASALLVFLLFLGDKGNTIAGPASLYVAVVTLIVTLLIKLVEAGAIRLPRTRAELSPMLIRVLVSAGMLGLVAVAGGSAWFVHVAVDEKQIPITEAVELVGGSDLADGGTATLHVPEPTRRTGLALTPLMESSDPRLGNCTGRSTIQLVLLLDGVARQEISGAISGAEVRLPLGGAVRSATLQISPRIPGDQECRVNLRVHEAFLFSESG